MDGENLIHTLKCFVRSRGAQAALLLLLAFGNVFGGCRRTAAAGPQVGATLPSVLAGARLRNAPVEEPGAYAGWVVHVFSPTAPSADGGAANLERLAKVLPAEWKLLAVATEAQGVAPFLARTRATVPVLTQVPPAALDAYGGERPRTFVLDRDWKLLETIEGPFDDAAAARLAARFKVSLPAAAPAVPASPEEAEQLGQLCFDRQHRPYSRGAEATALGLRYQCGGGGLWVPAQP